MRLFIALAASLLPVSAATIYNNGTPNAMGGVTFSHFRVVDDFALASNATVIGLRFWTFNNAFTIADLTWAIYAENTGLPGAVVQSGSATNVVAIAEINNIQRREISVNFALSAGDYFIEFHAASALTVEGPFLSSWAFTADNTTDRYRQGDLTAVPTIETGSPDSGTRHAAFQLDGTFDSEVPEPSSVALAALGFSALWCKRSSRLARIRRG